MVNNNAILDNSLHLKVIEDCVNDALLLQGKAMSLSEEKDKVILKVQKAKLWLKRQPEYIKFLEHLQTIFHQENTQLFSELLTYFVKDVLNKDKDIVFDLYTYHNLPALKIEAMQNGHREDIYAGNGGSIVNIVSTGLRLIALSRMQNRKFIVLDEPDCWLKPDHVPFFAKIIGEISSQLGIQTIIVSHHSWEYFKDYGRVVELSLQGQQLQADIIHDTPFNMTDEEYEQSDLIKTVRLNRFMSHYDTTFELHPHLTCLVGENDIGKSVLPTALRAVSYNDSSDSYIKHNETEAQIYIELTQGRSILWQRFLKTTQENPQKVKYSLFLSGNVSDPAHHEFNSNTTPDFIQKELKICATEDIDVHINNQKQPVFLISSDTKPQQRAKILSLGKESLYIQKIMETIKSKTKIFKQDEKLGEIRFAQINKILDVLENIAEQVESGKKLKTEYAYAVEQLANVENSKDFLKQWKINEEFLSLGTIDIPSIPDVVNTEEHNFIYKNWTINSSLSEVKIIKSIPEIPDVLDTSEANDILRNLIVLNQLSAVGTIHDHIKTPDITDTTAMTNGLKTFKTLTELSQVGILNTDINTPELIDVSQMIMRLQQWTKLSQLHNVGIIQSNVQSPELQSTKEAEEILENWITAMKTVEEKSKEYNLLLAEQKNIEQELEEYFVNIGNVCPTCKQSVSSEHIHNI